MVSIDKSLGKCYQEKGELGIGNWELGLGLDISLFPIPYSRLPFFTL
ncbi:hypothetical protein [Nostoc sp. ChiQUE02]